MSSRSTTAPRRVPQQERGERRVAGLLRAAARVIAETGYERATMCAIAERGRASIGSLYQFFPNKESVAEALRARYAQETESVWADLALKAKGLPVRQLVGCLIDSQIQFAESHAAFLALLDAPPTTHTARRRKLMQQRIAKVLLARRPRMSRPKALRIAAVMQHIFRGLLALYARSAAEEKGAVVDEFKSVLGGYLAPKLCPRGDADWI
ncbi:MAG: TetR family transcriptional regulator [Terriglobia bacterium]